MTEPQPEGERGGSSYQNTGENSNRKGLPPGAVGFNGGIKLTCKLSRRWLRKRYSNLTLLSPMQSPFSPELKEWKPEGRKASDSILGYEQDRAGWREHLHEQTGISGTIGILKGLNREAPRTLLQYC